MPRRRRCNSGLKGRIALHFRPFSDTGVVMSYSCPLCHAPLSRRDNSYICPLRHQFDLAKEGYVNLLPVQFKRSRDPGDSAEMMQARRAFLDAGHINLCVMPSVTFCPSPPLSACLISAAGKGTTPMRLPLSPLIVGGWTSQSRPFARRPDAIRRSIFASHRASVCRSTTPAWMRWSGSMPLVMRRSWRGWSDPAAG